MNVELRPRTFGELLGLCFKLPAAHFGKLLVTQVVLTLPLLALQLGLVGDVLEMDANNPELAGRVVGFGLLTVILALLIVPVQQGATILVVSGSFTGNHLPVGACLQKALGRFFGLLGYSFVTQIIVAIGFVLLIVPGCIFLTWFYVGAPALMIERISMASAITRSRELSSGYRWGIFGLLLLTGVLVGVFTQVFHGVLVATMPAGTIRATLAFLIQQILSMVMVVGPVVYYFNLRVVKDAFDVEQLSSLVEAIAARGEANA